MKDKVENRRLMLQALADSIDPDTGQKIPLNCSQLQKNAGIDGRQTAVNLVRQLHVSGYLDMTIGQWSDNRKGRYTRYYTLNDYGMQMSKIFQALDQVRNRKGSATDIGALDFLLDTFRKAMARGKSPARNYQWSLIMTSDAEGQLSWKFEPKDLSV